MKVEVFSDKFVTEGNPNGRKIIDTDDAKDREALGAKVIKSILATAEEEAADGASEGDTRKGT